LNKLSSIGQGIVEELEIEAVHKLIGQNVAKYRKEKHISQLDLSLKLGHKSVSIVTSAERFYKKRHFNIEHLIKIAHILEVDICDLLKPYK
jgi:transcriptional regulator with XRE-family HTH domain